MRLSARSASGYEGPVDDSGKAAGGLSIIFFKTNVGVPFSVGVANWNWKICLVFCKASIAVGIVVGSLFLTS